MGITFLLGVTIVLLEIRNVQFAGDWLRPCRAVTSPRNPIHPPDESGYSTS